MIRSPGRCSVGHLDHQRPRSRERGSDRPTPKSGRITTSPRYQTTLTLVVSQNWHCRVGLRRQRRRRYGRPSTEGGPSGAPSRAAVDHDPRPAIWAHATPLIRPSLWDAPSVEPAPAGGPARRPSSAARCPVLRGLRRGQRVTWTQHCLHLRATGVRFRDRGDSIRAKSASETTGCFSTYHERSHRRPKVARRYASPIRDPRGPETESKRGSCAKSGKRRAQRRLVCYEHGFTQTHAKIDLIIEGKAC